MVIPRACARDVETTPAAARFLQDRWRDPNRPAAIFTCTERNRYATRAEIELPAYCPKSGEQQETQIPARVISAQWSGQDRKCGRGVRGLGRSTWRPGGFPEPVPNLARV